MNSTDPLADYLYEEASMIYLEIDQSGLIIGANKSARELLPIQLQITRFDDLPVDFTSFTSFQNIKSDGSERYLFSLSTKLMPITLWFRFYERNNAIAAFGELDYAETQAMDEVITTINRELSNLARELEKKRILLTEAIKERNRLIGIVAHDLRNPISNIQSLAILVKEDLSAHIPQDQTQMLDLIIEQSTFMRTLLDGMLDLTAIECGELRLKEELFEIGGLLKYTVTLHKLQSDHKKITLRIDAAPALPALFGDRVKLIQALSNLVSNALKFSQPGTEIVLRAEISNSLLHITASDQGPGIPEVEQSKLFHPFSKLSPRPTDGESSTGLGLVIVNKIIAAHGGHIEVESHLGQGTTMHIYLPLTNKSKEQSV